MWKKTDMMPDIIHGKNMASSTSSNILMEPARALGYLDTSLIALIVCIHYELDH